MNLEKLQAGQVLPLVRVVNGCPDPVELFVRLTNGGLQPDTLLLESGDTSTHQGEKSLLMTRCALRARCFGLDVEVIALNPNGLSLLPWLAEQLGPQAELNRKDSVVRVRFSPIPKGSEDQRLKAPSPVDVLRLMARGPGLVFGQASLGPLVAGVFSYDLLGLYEHLNPFRRDSLGWPDFEFWLPDQMVYVQHKQRNTTMLAFVYGGEHATGVYHDATAAISRLTEATESLLCPKPQDLPATAQQMGHTEVDIDDQAYAEMVEMFKKHIVAGDVFQAVPSRIFSTSCPRSMEAYRQLRVLNPSPYMFFVNGSRGVLFGASPETAVRVDGSPLRIEIRPIAGTRPRGRRSDGSLDLDLDSRMEADLRLCEKEVAEHMMLVDLARNDVARVSKPGTRRVERLLGVDRYSHVMHLVSYVSGQLREDMDGLGAYVATMNMGTLVGAPKIKAADLLRQYELDKRGPYGGAVGYFTADGRLDTSIIIRSAVVRDGVAHVRAGAGVVYDSDPMAEAEETRRKAQAVLQAIWATHREGR